MKTNDKGDKMSNSDGLFLSGTVSQRSKKLIGEDKLEVVTYLVNVDEKLFFYLDDFQPDSYFAIGEKISVPVICRPFMRKNEKMGLSYTVRKENSHKIRGQVF